jgi:HSP20 family protein
MANLIRKRQSPPSLSRDIDQPFGDILSPSFLRRELERVFNDFFTSSGTERAFVPSLELSERDKEFIMKAELPGMKPEEVEVSIDEDNVLTVRGEKMKEEVKEEGGYSYNERSYGQFMRSVRLPSSVVGDKIEASFENGILELHIPKSEQGRARKVPVRAAQQEKEKKQEAAPSGDGSRAQQPEQQARH